jgi:hypothetical protein
VVFHVSQVPNRPAILIKLHLESELVHAATEIAIDNAPLPDGINIAVGPLILERNSVEVSKVGLVLSVTQGMRNVAKVFFLARIRSRTCERQLMSGMRDTCLSIA